MKKVSKTTLESLRKLAIVQQGLHQRPEKVDETILLDTIKKIGLLQLDSINVVQRSHYIVLFSRVGFYETSLVDKLQYPDKKLIEQWVHVASLIPSDDFLNLSPEILARRKRPLSNRKQKVLGKDYKQILASTLDKIKSVGHISSNEFKEINPNRKNWWSKKPSRVALDVLFRRGYVSVAFRKNFKCYYDLQERVCKLEKNGNLMDFYKWAVVKSIDAMGAATIEHISDYYRIEKKNVQKAITSLLKESILIELHVDEFPDTLYITKKNYATLAKIIKGEIKIKLTTLLSPFDNLIWHRDRTETLFKFFYRSEMYTPSVNRKFGYYVLPILHDGSLIGRLDPKLDRRTNTLIISNLFFEKGTKFSSYTIKSIAKAIIEFSKFVKAKKIQIKDSEPKHLAISVSDYIASE